MSILSTEATVRLVRALGLDPDMVSRLVITMEPMRPVMVEVTQYLSVDGEKTAATELRRFTLVERPEDKR